MTVMGDFITGLIVLVYILIKISIQWILGLVLIVVMSPLMLLVGLGNLIVYMVRD